MKKILSIIMSILMSSILFYGCSTNASETKNNSVESDSHNEISKAQKVRILTVDDSEEIKSMTSKEDITNFIKKLDQEHWEEATIPEDAKESLIIKCCQEKTLKWGETKTDGKLYDTCNYVIYKDIPYATFNVWELSFDYKISDRAYKYFNEILSNKENKDSKEK